MTTMEQNAPIAVAGTEGAELEAAEQLAGLGRWRWRPGSRVLSVSPGMARIVGALRPLTEIGLRDGLRMLPAADRKALF
ncbi:MAG: hypothetical protein EOP19_22045, partial [Hyphomicrobiales bacterium]